MRITIELPTAMLQRLCAQAQDMAYDANELATRLIGVGLDYIDADYVSLRNVARREPTTDAVATADSSPKRTDTGSKTTKQKG